MDLASPRSYLWWSLISSNSNNPLKIHALTYLTTTTTTGQSSTKTKREASWMTTPSQWRCLKQSWLRSKTVPGLEFSSIRTLTQVQLLVPERILKWRMCCWRSLPREISVLTDCHNSTSRKHIIEWRCWLMIKYDDETIINVKHYLKLKNVS